MRTVKFLAAATITMSSLASSAHAADISFVKGVYQSSKNKDGGDAALSSNTISLGGRYMDELTDDQVWFSDAELGLISYDAPKDAPDNANNISIGGGIRHYFPNWSENFIPFINTSARFQTMSQVMGWSETNDVVTYQTRTTSGLYYGSDIGMRMSLDEFFFLDLEIPLFGSALAGTVKDETTSGGNISKSEVSSTDLYFETFGALTRARVSFGMRI